MPWADLVRRVWLVDILRCECGGRRTVLAMVFNPKSIERVLDALGLGLLVAQARAASSTG